MDYCTQIESLRNALVREINNSGLTLGAGYLVVKDFFNIIHLEYLNELEKERLNMQKLEEHQLDIEIPQVEQEERKEHKNDEQNND